MPARRHSARRTTREPVGVSAYSIQNRVLTGLTSIRPRALVWLAIGCPARPARFAIATVILLAPLAPLLTGCASDLPPPIEADASTRLRPTQVVADWDDIETAAWAAGPRVEMTVAHGEHLDAVTQTVELVSSRDEVCILTARRDPPPPGTPPGSDADRGENATITLEFKIGRFGDPAREWAFLTDLVDRLEDLRGVGAAPIRWNAR